MSSASLPRRDVDGSRSPFRSELRKSHGRTNAEAIEIERGEVPSATKGTHGSRNKSKKIEVLSSRWKWCHIQEDNPSTIFMNSKTVSMAAGGGRQGQRKCLLGACYKGHSRCLQTFLAHL
nr:PREDICTED: uncharacterized protein LOC103987506 [Musa acuminata subsp. malaccensis]